MTLKKRPGRPRIYKEAMDTYTFKMSTKHRKALERMARSEDTTIAAILRMMVKDLVEANVK